MFKPRYQILQRFLRPEIQIRQALQPDRLVIHSTANPGAGDEAHFQWLDGERRHGWGTYYLDHDSISQLVPEGLVAPAQGPTMNRRALSIEICEPSRDLPLEERQRRFNEAWARAVWLSADIAFRWGWDLHAILSHYQVSQMYPAETDHTDPVGFFNQYGRKWVDFLGDVEAELHVRRSEYTPAHPYQSGFMDELLATGLIADRRHPRQPVEWWELAAVVTRALKHRPDEQKGE